MNYAKTDVLGSANELIIYYPKEPESDD